MNAMNQFADNLSCNALVLLSVNPHTKFETPSFTHSKDMIGAPKSKKNYHMTLTTPG